MADTQKKLLLDAQTLLTNVAQILDVVKGEWGPAWSAWDQEQRDGITNWLKASYDDPDLVPYKPQVQP